MYRDNGCLGDAHNHARICTVNISSIAPNSMAAELPMRSNLLADLKAMFYLIVLIRRINVTKQVEILSLFITGGMLASNCYSRKLI